MLTHNALESFLSKPGRHEFEVSDTPVVVETHRALEESYPPTVIIRIGLTGWGGRYRFDDLTEAARLLVSVLGAPAIEAVLAAQRP